MSFLNWISDENLKECVKHLLKTAKEAKAAREKDFGKNVIDPFSAIFEISGFDIDLDSWILSEKNRQAQKTLQNHIGDFHQKILGFCNGWENMKTGRDIDLVCHEKKIIAELKNKFNTVSGGKLVDIYNTLDSLVMPKNSIYKSYTAYYVAIIPKSKYRYDKEFTPSNKANGAKCSINAKIREIDGASFYDLVTGEKNSLEKLFTLLPKVIQTVSNGEVKIKDFRKLRVFFDSAFESIQ